MSICRPVQVATMANSLYHSLLGQYFVGTTDLLYFNNNQFACASLANPRHSGVNVFVNVWTVTNFHDPLVDAEIFLDAVLPVSATASGNVTTTNLAIRPSPVSAIKLMQASNVPTSITGKVNAYGRLIPSGSTVADEEDGKFIIPPGGNFTVVLSNADGTAVTAKTRVAFGWWESVACS